MQPYAIWRSRPVFVTSIFRGMHTERNHLNNVVFPELEERLKARFHHLEPLTCAWWWRFIPNGRWRSTCGKPWPDSSREPMRGDGLDLRECPIKISCKC